MRKVILGTFIVIAPFCSRMHAMFLEDGFGRMQDRINEATDDYWMQEEEYKKQEEEYQQAVSHSSSLSAALQADLQHKNNVNNKSDSVDQCIDQLIITLPKIRAAVERMQEANALNMKSIARFYGIAASPYYYLLCGAEFLVRTACNEESSLAPAAKCVYALAKTIPILANNLVRFEPTNNNNNNNGRASSSASDMPVSRNAYRLRYLNHEIIKVLKENESAGNKILNAVHAFVEKNGDQVLVSFLHNKRHDIKQYAAVAQKYSPVFIDGFKAAYARYAAINAQDQQVNKKSDKDADNGDAAGAVVNAPANSLDLGSQDELSALRLFEQQYEADYGNQKSDDKGMSWWCN